MWTKEAGTAGALSLCENCCRLSLQRTCTHNWFRLLSRKGCFGWLTKTSLLSRWLPSSGLGSLQPTPTGYSSATFPWTRPKSLSQWSAQSRAGNSLSSSGPVECTVISPLVCKNRATFLQLVNSYVPVDFYWVLSGLNSVFEKCPGVSLLQLFSRKKIGPAPSSLQI